MRTYRLGITRGLSSLVLLLLAACGGGGGSGGGPPRDTVAPTTPTGLTATASSSISIELAWSASTDDSGSVLYEIYRNGSQIGQTAATHFTDTGNNIQPSTTYVYEVLARDPAANASPRASASGRTDDPTLYRVWGIQAVCGAAPGACPGDVLLGEARTTHTFQGAYLLYGITTARPDRCQVDAVSFSDGTYLSFLSQSSNTEDVPNAFGSPNGSFAIVGLLRNCISPDIFYGCYLGGWAVLGPGGSVTSVTVHVFP